MRITTLEELLVDELRDIYSAENQLIKDLPKMAKSAASDDLRMAFEKHLEQTRMHARRIEEICNNLNVGASGKKCVGMEGLIEEKQELLQNVSDVQPREAALIGAAQRMEHYEISAYGTARAHAGQLGYIKAANLLGLTLEDEKQTDELLTKLAENHVNVKAAMVDSQAGKQS